MKIQDEIKEIIASGTCDGNLYHLPQVDRSQYVKIKKAVEVCGGKWDRYKKAHVFDGLAQEAIDTMLYGEIRDKKKELQAFYTPEAVAKKVIELADIQDGETVMEPSAGTGNIAKFLPKDNPLVCFEIDSEAAEKLAVELQDFTQREIFVKDFLEVQPRITDKVVMNPPFTKNQWSKHINHALNCLPRILVSVIPACKGTREFDKLESLLKEEEYVFDYEILDSGSFKKSGTNVNTAILTIRDPYSEVARIECESWV